MKSPTIWCGLGMICGATSDKNVFTLTVTPLFKEMMNSKGEDPDEYIERCSSAMQTALDEFMREQK